MMLRCDKGGEKNSIVCAHEVSFRQLNTQSKSNPTLAQMSISIIPSGLRCFFAIFFLEMRD